MKVEYLITTQWPLGICNDTLHLIILDICYHEVEFNWFYINKTFPKIKFICHIRVLNFNLTSMRFLTYPRYDAVVRKNHVTKTEIDFYLIRTSDEDVLPIYNSSC